MFCGGCIGRRWKFVADLHIHPWVGLRGVSARSTYPSGRENIYLSVVFIIRGRYGSLWNRNFALSRRASSLPSPGNFHYRANGNKTFEKCRFFFPFLSFSFLIAPVKVPREFLSRSAGQRFRPKNLYEENSQFQGFSTTRSVVIFNNINGNIKIILSITMIWKIQIVLFDNVVKRSVYSSNDSARRFSFLEERKADLYARQKDILLLFANQ